MQKSKNAAIYARYSSSNQREESIDASTGGNQRRKINNTPGFLPGAFSYASNGVV